MIIDEGAWWCKRPFRHFGGVALSDRIYCTCFDHRYLPRGLALIESLRHHGAYDEVWILCLSDKCFDVLSTLNLAGVRPVRLQELEDKIPGLRDSKATRATIEFYYTCAPAFTEFALKNSADAQVATYLDSDLWFFENPDSIFAEIGDASTAIIPHNFTEKNRALERFGTYNVGWVSFRRSKEGLKCLQWWQESCIDWCYGYIDGERFADQGYLNQFQTIAPNTNIIRQKGANLAPWNIANYRVTKRDNAIFLDDDPLVFFHFHGVNRAFGVLYFDSHRSFGAPHSAIIRNDIYRPYIAALLRAEQKVRNVSPVVDDQGVKLRGNNLLGLDVKNLGRHLLRRAHQAADVVSGRPILAWNDRVF
jgi:hypothetical protein